MKHKFLIFYSTLSFFFVSCKKDNEPSKTQLLTESRWIYQDAKRNGVSIFTTIQACSRDNLFYYKTNGELTIDDGPTKCNSADPQTANFAWFFFSNEDSISINNIRTKILEISKTQFITEQTMFMGDKYVYIFGK